MFIQKFMSIRDEILAVLSSRETRQINFNFQSVTGSRVEVSSLSFQRVATAIRRGIIVPSDNLTELNDSSDLAEYHSSNNRMVALSPRHNFENEAVIIHESIHASFDLTRSVLPKVDDELAGFFAEAFYLRLKDAPINFYTHSATVVAKSAVETILGGGSPTTAQISNIRSRILADTGYSYDVRQGCGRNRRIPRQNCSGEWYLSRGDG